MSHNFVASPIPSVVAQLAKLSYLDLAHCNLQGCNLKKFPEFLEFQDQLAILEFSDNQIQGLIPTWVWNSSKETMTTFWAHDNLLTGFEKHPIVIPWQNLVDLDLSFNKLQGLLPIPPKSTHFYSVKGNILTGEIAPSICIDNFPVWLGTLPELKVLILRNNKFYGGIENLPINAGFSKLRIIDLSSNNFSGYLPVNYFRKWEAMKVVHKDESEYMNVDAIINNSQIAFLKIKYHWPYIWIESYPDSITIVNKGTQRNFGRIKTTFVSIDLSNNGFKGQIPEFLGNLKGLRSLNLSNNELEGPIPSSLGNLVELESLDLSQNLLSGKIPRQLTHNTFLAIFNVSYNNLTGLIPQGAQFDTFENSSYEGPSSPPSSSLQLDRNSKSPGTIDWVVIILGYGSGVIVGLVLGQALTKRNHKWFVKTFGRQQQRRKRVAHFLNKDD
ncbi:unnamed protein product [Thlaspi arvense]|uniref:Uncharacterized protein n=1 Tax=Thlaspi arvense TaxID=13288 RepID=A0AAU9SPF5_THLAR|nr:unnamed protein product [Thlaspi arvense]